MCPIPFVSLLLPRTKQAERRRAGPVKRFDLDVLKREERLPTAMINELSHFGRGATRCVDPNECFADLSIAGHGGMDALGDQDAETAGVEPAAGQLHHADRECPL